MKYTLIFWHTKTLFLNSLLDLFSTHFRDNRNQAEGSKLTKIIFILHLDFDLLLQRTCFTNLLKIAELQQIIFQSRL